MADETPNAKQDEIEDLLRKAQMASGLVPEGATAPDAGVATATATPPTPELAAVGVKTATLEPPRSTYSPRPASDANLGDDVQFLLNQAEQAIRSVEQPVDVGIPGLAPFELKDLGGAPASGDKATLELL